MTTSMVYDAVECAQKGRCAIAKQRIRTSTRVLQTSAYAWVSVSSCNWCLKQSQCSPLQRCGGCHRVKYCSRKCQQLDWQQGLHRNECAAWKQIPQHIAGESMQTVLLVTRLAAKLYLTEPSENATETAGQAVLRLRHHYADHSQGKVRQYREMAQLVLLLLVRSKFNTSQSSFEELSEVLEEKVMLLFCRVNCNAFTISDDLCAPLGIGVFPNGALFNHSCEPNCIVSFHEQQMVVRVVKDVEQGEELTISYVELLESTSKRKQALRESYFFDCECPRCVDALAEPGQGIKDDWYLDGYSCWNPKCGPEGVVVVEETDAAGSAFCTSCGSERSIAEIQRRERECEVIERDLNQRQLSAIEKWRRYRCLWLFVDDKLHLHRRNMRVATLSRQIGTFLVEAAPSIFPDGVVAATPIDYFIRELQATEWILPTMKLPSRGLLHFQLAKLYYEEKDSSRRCSEAAAIQSATDHFHRALSILDVAYGSENELVQAARSHLEEAIRSSQTQTH